MYISYIYIHYAHECYLYICVYSLLSGMLEELSTEADHI